jgi:hypothetical protein
MAQCVTVHQWEIELQGINKTFTTIAMLLICNMENGVYAWQTIQNELGVNE